MTRVRYLLLIIMLTISGCSTMGDLAMKAVGGMAGVEDKGLEVELDAQIGDRATEAETQLGGRSVKGTGDITAAKGSKVQVLNKQTDSNIEKADRVSITNESIPPWVLIMLLAGWILPDPARLYSWVKGSIFKRKVNE